MTHETTPDEIAKLRNENGEIDARTIGGKSERSEYKSKINVSDAVDAPHERGEHDQYSDAQIATAIRRTRKHSRYQKLTLGIYKSERKSHYPHPSTIVKRFGKWTDAKAAAFPEEHP